MKKFTLMVIIIGTMFTLNAQVTSSTFDPTWAAEFQTAIDDAMYATGIHGTSVAIYFPGQGTFIGVGGESTDGVPITPDMQLCIGSNTKLFTSVTLLKLQEIGALSLDDPLSDWLPEYQYVDPTTTIRQLLSHQSGIFDWGNEVAPHVADSIFFSDPDHFYTHDEILAMLAPPNFAPGTGWSYSNTNYLLAGMVIEAASGKSYVENLHQYIFDPLDMDSTFVGEYEEPNGNVVNGWSVFSDSTHATDMGTIPNTATCSMGWGMGSIYSTPKEMTEWFDALFNKKTILNQSSLDQLLNFEPSSNYGLGITVDWFSPEDDAYVHFGGYGGYSSTMGYDVKSGSVTCVIVNQDSWTGAEVLDVLLPVLSVYYLDFYKQPDDAGIVSITSPALTGCATNVTPEVVLKNFGKNNLTSATINYQVDGGTIYTYNWSGLLLSDETAAVQLPQMTFTAGTHVFQAFTSNPNGQAEGFTFNDGKQSDFIVNQVPVPSINEGFEGATFPPAGWLNGLNATLNWHRTTLSSYNGDASVVKNNSKDNTGRSYDLDLPAVEVSNMQNPVLSFYYAYADWEFETEDAGLEVLTSTNCGATYQSQSYPNHELPSTAPASTDVFYPTAGQWQQAGIDLPKNADEVWIRIRDFSAPTTNLYLDEIKVADQCSAPYETSARNVKATSANAHWKYNGEATSFTVYYEVTGTNVWSTKTAAGTVRSVRLPSLIPATTYDGYVIASCTLGTSPHSPVFSFTTSSNRLDDLMTDEISVTVYPNPTSATATLEIELDENENVQLSLVNITGQVINEWNIGEVSGTFTHQIDVSKLPDGVYLIRCSLGDNTSSQKLIVQH